MKNDVYRGRNRRKGGRPANGDGVKYLTGLQIKKLRRYARDRAVVGAERGLIAPILGWIVVDVLTSSGVRVGEAADLRCGDVRTGYGESALFVRSGKGNKSRTVEIPASLRRHLKRFLQWKAERGEPTGADDPLLVGQRGPLSPQGVQLIVKGALKATGLYEPGRSAHCLRHSFAVAVYRKSRDLRAVQKLLGHSRIETTTIYADVTREDLAESVSNLWGGVS